jgi:hypothetical protein
MTDTTREEQALQKLAKILLVSLLGLAVTFVLAGAAFSMMMH